MPEIEAQARGLLRQALGAEAVGERGDVVREATPAWNSLLHVDLIFLLEDAFAVEFTEEEMAELDSLSAIVAAVERRRAA